MRYLFFSLTLVVLFSCGDSPESNSDNGSETLSAAEMIEKGKELFNLNCKVCHSLDTATPSGMAPVLVNIASNWPKQEQLAAYIKNAPAQMNKTPRGREIYKKWKNKAQMPPFEGLQRQEINQIVAFLYQAN